MASSCSGERVALKWKCRREDSGDRAASRGWVWRALCAGRECVSASTGVGQSPATTFCAGWKVTLQARLPVLPVLVVHAAFKMAPAQQRKAAASLCSGLGRVRCGRCVSSHLEPPGPVEAGAGVTWTLLTSGLGRLREEDCRLEYQHVASHGLWWLALSWHRCRWPS